MDEFKNLDELYKRLTPAFDSKCLEFKRIGLYYVERADLWNYLKENVWKNKKNLTLGEMVNDIMIISPQTIKDYLNSLLAKQKRIVIKKQKRVKK